MSLMKIYIYFLLFTNCCFSQINTDSLLQRLQRSYQQTRIQNHLMEDFLVFEDENKRDRYDVFFDSTQQLGEYIGLSILHYQYDSLNRITLLEGFNKSGQYSYWDFPPRNEYYYFNDTITPKLNRIKNELCNCVSPDSIGYIQTMVEYYFQEGFPDRVRTTEMSKDSLMKVFYVNKFDGSYMHNKEYVVFKFREYEKIGKKFITQERFYDVNFELINKKHLIGSTDRSGKFASIDYAYSIREVDSLGIRKIYLYDSKNELVDETNNSIIEDSGPIKVGSPPKKRDQRKYDRWVKRHYK